MKKVILYTKPMCGYCARALALFKRKGVETIDISAAYDKDLRAEMLAKSNGKTTFPQIFIDDVHVGGYDELFALDIEDKLDALLNA